MSQPSRHLALALFLAALTDAAAQTRHLPAGRAAANLDAIARRPQSHDSGSNQPPREVYEPERALRRRYAAAARRHSEGTAGIPVPAAPPSAALVVGGFAGLGDNFRAIPPDTTGAVGPHDVVTMLNTQVSIQSRTGATRPNYPITVASFWSPLGAYPDGFDPRI